MFQHGKTKEEGAIELLQQEEDERKTKQQLLIERLSHHQNFMLIPPSLDIQHNPAVFALTADQRMMNNNSNNGISGTNNSRIYPQHSASTIASAAAAAAAMQIPRSIPPFAVAPPPHNKMNVGVPPPLPPAIKDNKNNKRKFSPTDEDPRGYLSSLSSLQDTSEKKRRAVSKLKATTSHPQGTTAGKEHQKLSKRSNVPPATSNPSPQTTAAKAWQLFPRLTATAVNLIETNKQNNTLAAATPAGGGGGGGGGGSNPLPQPIQTPWTEEMTVLELLGKVALERRRQSEEAALAAAKASFSAAAPGTSSGPPPPSLLTQLPQHYLATAAGSSASFPVSTTTIPSLVGGGTTGLGQLKSPPPPPQYPGGATTMGGQVAGDQTNLPPGLSPLLSQLLVGGHLPNLHTSHAAAAAAATAAFPPSPNVAAQLAGGRSFDELGLALQRLIQQQQQQQRNGGGGGSAGR